MGARRCNPAGTASVCGLGVKRLNRDARMPRGLAFGLRSLPLARPALFGKGASPDHVPRSESKRDAYEHSRKDDTAKSEQGLPLVVFKQFVFGFPMNWHHTTLPSGLTIWAFARVLARAFCFSFE